MSSPGSLRTPFWLSKSSSGGPWELFGNSWGGQNHCTGSIDRDFGALWAPLGVLLTASLLSLSTEIVMPQGHAAEAAKPWGRLLHIILGQRHCGGVGAQRIEIRSIKSKKSEVRRILVQGVFDPEHLNLLVS